MLNESLRRKDRINPFQGTPHAGDVKKHVDEQEEILDGIIREGVRYKISGFEEIEFSLPDTAEMRSVVKELGDWSPERPGFFRRLYIDFSNLSLKYFRLEGSVGGADLIGGKAVVNLESQAEK